MKHQREKHGRVNYGSRAFHQDAQEAMRGDIIRGLIELITNSDDAYKSDKGKIRIEVNHAHGAFTVVVRDRATGMGFEDIEKKIAGLGGRTSGFESGQDVRGNLGRGAKDLAAFGPVEFESIHNGAYAKLRLETTGDYSLTNGKKATEELRQKLHITGNSNGTVVTVFASEHIRCPQHNKLAERLTRHYQLRDICGDSKREVLLVHAGKKQQDVLRYVVPSLPIAFKGKLTAEGYPDAVAEVEIYRLPERSDDPPSDPYRPNGLLITGRRAIYDNALFKYEGNPHAGWFCGRVRCPYIDTLAAEYDRRLEKGEEQLPNNPIPIITRRREGLQSSHPFVKALSKAIEKPLGDLVAEEAKKASREGVRTSTALRKNLDALGRDLARLIDEELRESELEGLLGAGPIGADFPAIKLIPPNVVIYAGEEKTVTVVVRADTKAAEASCSLDPEGVVEVMKESTVTLESHRRRPELLVGRFNLRPLGDPGECLITIAAGNNKEVGEVEVRPAREIIEVELEQPDSLKFERDSYRVTWMKKKRLRLLAPLELIAKEGPKVRVTSDSSGVVVLGQDLNFGFNEEGEYYFVDATIDARELGATATVRAKCGNQETISKVTVARDADGPELRIVPVDEEAGFRRALVEQNGQAMVIKIMGRHPSLKRYLGPPPEFPDQDEPITRAVIAEIVAGEAARMVMERKFTAGAGSGLLDAANFYGEHLKLLSKYLARCHEHLVGDRPRSLLSEEPAAEVITLAKVEKK